MRACASAHAATRIHSQVATREWRSFSSAEMRISDNMHTYSGHSDLYWHAISEYQIRADPSKEKVSEWTAKRGKLMIFPPMQYSEFEIVLRLTLIHSKGEENWSCPILTPLYLTVLHKLTQNLNSNTTDAHRTILIQQAPTKWLNWRVLSFWLSAAIITIVSLPLFLFFFLPLSAHTLQMHSSLLFHSIYNWNYDNFIILQQFYMWHMPLAVDTEVAASGKFDFFQWQCDFCRTSSASFGAAR